MGMLGLRLHSHGCLPGSAWLIYFLALPVGKNRYSLQGVFDFPGRSGDCFSHCRRFGGACQLHVGLSQILLLLVKPMIKQGYLYGPRSLVG
jgi:hypothetical protein